MPLPPAEQLPIRIDFAVTQTTVDPGLVEENFEDLHIVDLDYIYITEAQFKYIFYDQQENFYVNQAAKASQTLSPLISFSHKYRRTMDHKEFGLIDIILHYYCLDAGVNEEDFTPSSLIQLHKKIHQYADLRDVYNAKTPSGTYDANLTWDQLVYTVRAAYDNELESTIDRPEVILTYSVYFLPAPGVDFKTIVVKFNYKTNITLTTQEYDTLPDLDNSFGPTGDIGHTGETGPN